MRHYFLLLVLIFNTPVALGQDSGEDEPISDEQLSPEQSYAKFQLYNGCVPMKLVVAELSDKGREIGLSGESIQAAAESRLRASRLYDESAFDTLFINITVVNNAYAMVLSFHKFVFDLISSLTHQTPTWISTKTGTHGNDRGYIMSSLSEEIDIFLVEYLRVNESDCE